MTNIFRAVSAAAMIVAAAPAAGQVLLLDVATTVPMAGTLDNPCTPLPEAIVFSGSTALAQRLWLLPDGNLRLQFYESTAMAGQAVTSPLLPAVKYAFSGEAQQDLVFEPLAISVLQYKKVQQAGASDNFHAVLVLSIDPQNLRVDLKLEGACDNGMP
jgi:hypothetical protein